MAQLRRDYEKFVQKQTELVVVGPESAQKFADYWQSNQLPFVGLPDPKHRVLKLFGQQVKIFRLGRMPAQVLVDQQGMARHVHYGHSMSDIPRNEDMLAQINRLKPLDGKDF